jgi:hypothetical protein
MPYISRLSACALVLAAGATGCLTDDPQAPPPGLRSDPDAVGLVAHVQTRTGGTLEFYEPEPGFLFVTGSERPGAGGDVHRLDFARLSPDEIYALATDDAAAPAPLVAAYARAVTRGLDAAVDDGDSDPIDVAITQAPPADPDAPEERDGGVYKSSHSDELPDCNRRTFTETYCEGGDGSWCWLNGTGDSTRVENDVVYANGAVCPYRGQLSFHARVRPWYKWKNVGDWDVEQDTVRWWWDLTFTDQDFKTAVRDADGNGYHHGGTWRHNH